MRSLPSRDPEGPWFAVLCTGILLTSLAATVCVALIALYRAPLGGVRPVLACFLVGALLVVVGAARLDAATIRRAKNKGR